MEELTALAASYATALVALMASDSWAQVRGRLSRFFTQDNAAENASDELEAARNTLVAADEAGDRLMAARVEAAWRERLLKLLLAQPQAGTELRELLLSGDAPSPEDTPPAVHNVISGGTQYGPVVQAGRITGATFHSPGSDGPQRESGQGGPSRHPFR